jgi:hypothetical protein
MNHGVYYGMPPEEYHTQTDLALTSTIAKALVAQSPAHVRATVPLLGGERREASDALDFGSLVHLLVLGKGHRVEVGDFDDYRTVRARQWRDHVRAHGAIPVLERQHERATKAAGAVREQLDDMGLLDLVGNPTEVAIAWSQMGCECRTQLDALHVDAARIVDLKTCESAHPRDIERTVINYGYDVQASFSIQGMNTLMPELNGRWRFVFVFVEKEPPYVVTPVELSGEWLAIGLSKVMRAMDRWARCVETGRWPAYAQEILRLDPPKWALPQEMGAQP